MGATVSHFELPALDPERAAAFYRQVFGWEVEPLPWQGVGPGESYFTVRTGSPSQPAPGGFPGAIQGGLGSSGAIGAGHPLLVIHLDGPPVEGWLGRIEEAGGRAVGEVRLLGGMGTFARFRDPEGNLLGLWRPEEP